MEIKVLGYGNVIYPDRKKMWPAILIKNPTGNILLDISPAYICASRNELNKIRIILLSHQHADHIVGFPLYAAYIASRKIKKENILVIGGKKTIKSVQRITEESYPEFSNLFLSPFKFIELNRKLEFIDLPGVRVIAKKVEHFGSDSYSFVVELGEVRIGYTGDVGNVSGLNFFFSGCDILFAEMGNRRGHLKREDIEILKRSVGKIFVIHSKDSDVPEIIRIPDHEQDLA